MVRGATKPRRIDEWVTRNAGRGAVTVIRLKDGRSFTTDLVMYNSFNHRLEFYLEGRVVVDGVLASQVEDVPSTEDLWPDFAVEKREATLRAE